MRVFMYITISVCLDMCALPCVQITCLLKKFTSGTRIDVLLFVPVLLYELFSAYNCPSWFHADHSSMCDDCLFVFKVNISFLPASELGRAGR